MSALSKLLAKVAIRAIHNAKDNDELYVAAERVIGWYSSDLISDEHLAQVEESMEEAVTDPETDSEPSEAQDGTITQDEDESPAESPSEPDAGTSDYSAITKAELMALCDERGIEYSSSWTKAQLVEALS